MDRRTFLEGASAAVLGTRRSAAQGPQPPNVVLILADDLGYGDLGCYGSPIRTPNIDRLASEGVRFGSFYAASPVCSPSRAALLTGRYPSRNGVPGVLQVDDAGGLPATETTMAAMLKGVGYRTACIGKWHLGSRPEYLPTNRGFDEYFGIPYSNDMWPLPLMSNNDVLEDVAQLDLLTQWFTERAVNFINRSKESPFFLYLAQTAPHIPLATAERFRARSPLGPYADEVEELDWSVGEVLNALESSDLTRNTIVMFLSDNGPWYQGSRGGLRGGKGETWDGGMRVPFLARYPDRIPANSFSKAVGTGMDILPTLAGLCGAGLPANQLDGVDIWPQLTGQQAVDREPFLYFDGWNAQCARMGQWKLHMSRYSRAAWSPDGPAGYVNLPLARPELYDVDTDPGESYECSRIYPQIVNEIRGRMESLIATFPPSVMASWRDTVNRRVEYTPAGALPIERRP